MRPSRRTLARAACAALVSAVLVAPTSAATNAAPASTEAGVTTSVDRPAECTSGSRVIKSVFAEDGDVDKSLIITANPTTSTATEQADRFGHIELAEGDTITDSGRFARYTTDRAIGDVFTVVTDTIAASPSGIAGDIDRSLTGILATSTDPISAANNGGAMTYSFTAGRGAVVGQTYTVYFHNTVQGVSDSDANQGGNTTRLFYTGYTVTIVPAKNCAPIRYDASGGTLRGSATVTETVPVEGTSTVTTTPLTADVPVRDGYTFVNWAKTMNFFGSTSTWTFKPEDTVSLATTKRTGFTWNQLVAENTVTAIWAPNYSLSYDANGGSSTPASEEGTFAVDKKTGTPIDDSVTKKAAGPIAREGYTFMGWKDKDTGEEFAPDANVALTTDAPTRILVAQWEKKEKPAAAPSSDPTPAPTSDPTPSPNAAPTARPTTPPTAEPSTQGTVQNQPASVSADSTPTAHPAAQLARTGASAYASAIAAIALVLGGIAVGARRRH